MEFCRSCEKGGSLGGQVVIHRVHEDVTHLTFERPVVASRAKLQVAYDIVGEQPDVDRCYGGLPANAIVSIACQERIRVSRGSVQMFRSDAAEADLELENEGSLGRASQRGGKASAAVSSSARSASLARVAPCGRTIAVGTTLGESGPECVTCLARRFGVRRVSRRPSRAVHIETWQLRAVVVPRVPAFSWRSATPTIIMRLNSGAPGMCHAGRTLEG